MTERQEQTVGEEQLVVFTLTEETYGINISAVNEIIRMQPVTDVPKTPDFVEGVINLRGKIVPVIDLRKRFGLGADSETQATRIMVVELNDLIVGMIVDSVSEVLRLSENDIEPTPPMVSGVDAEYLKGVGKWDDKLIILLDLDRILFKQERDQVARTIKEATAAVSKIGGGGDQ